MQLHAFVFWGLAALASLDCCSFSFLVLAFVGGLQLFTGSSSTTCDPVAETLNAIAGVSGVGCYGVRTFSVVLLLRTLWPLLFDAERGLVVGVLAAFC